MKGVRSSTSTMYQHFLAASQRAPSALAASFSANGVTRLIRITHHWRLAQRHLAAQCLEQIGQQLTQLARGNGHVSVKALIFFGRSAFKHTF